MIGPRLLKLAAPFITDEITFICNHSISVGRCVIPCAFFGKSVKHIFSCSKMYPN